MFAALFCSGALCAMSKEQAIKELSARSLSPEIDLEFIKRHNKYFFSLPSNHREYGKYIDELAKDDFFLREYEIQNAVGFIEQMLNRITIGKDEREVYHLKQREKHLAIAVQQAKLQAKQAARTKAQL